MLQPDACCEYMQAELTGAATADLCDAYAAGVCRLKAANCGTALRQLALMQPQRRPSH